MDPRAILRSVRPASSLARLLHWLAFLGVLEGDPEDVQAQKATLTDVATDITVLTGVWVAT